MVESADYSFQPKAFPTPPQLLYLRQHYRLLCTPRGTGISFPSPLLSSPSEFANVLSVGRGGEEGGPASNGFKEHA